MINEIKIVFLVSLIPVFILGFIYYKTLKHIESKEYPTIDDGFLLGIIGVSNIPFILFSSGVLLAMIFE